MRKYHYIYEYISNYQQVYIEQHAVCITDLEKWCWCQAQLLWQWKCQEREVCFDFCWWGFWCSMLVESESKKKYRYPDSQYQSSLEKSSYICVVLLYCTTTRYFLPWTRSRAWRVSQRRSWKDLVLLTTSPQWTFFVTQTQDGLWNIVHSTFMFFHIPYDDVKEGTTYIHRPGQI